MDTLLTTGLIASLAISTYNFHQIRKVKAEQKKMKIVLGGIVSVFTKAKKKHYVEYVDMGNFRRFDA